jgi:hypothetical protein
MKLLEAWRVVENNLKDDSNTHHHYVYIVDPSCFNQSSNIISQRFRGNLPPICRVCQHDREIGTEPGGDDSWDHAKRDADELEFIWAHLANGQPITSTVLLRQH